MVLCAALVAQLVAACGVLHPSNLNFVVDTRLHFTAPKSGTLVQTPVTVRWTMRSFSGGTFAVFVDRAPVKPGQTLRAVAAGDTLCAHRAGCPDAAYLESRRVFTTRVPSITLELIPPIPHNVEHVQYHAITVILLDSAGRRVGESSWELDLRMRKVGL